MTLEDFEKSLVKESGTHLRENNSQQDCGKKHRHHRHRDEPRDHRHRHKRRRYSGDEDDRNHRKHGRVDNIESEDSKSFTTGEQLPDAGRDAVTLQRDGWMVQSAGPEIEYTQRPAPRSPEDASKKPKADFELKIHENELNKHHLQNLAEGVDSTINEPTSNSDQDVDYTFGDAGAQWRMTKLKGVYRRAKEERRQIDDVAVSLYGDLRIFDDAREEEIELGRRETYGKEYSGKEKPDGELFRARKPDMKTGTQIPGPNGLMEDGEQSIEELDTESPPVATVHMDQTALNRLKAQMMKAKFRRAPDAAALEAKYNAAVAEYASGKQSGEVVLGAMENRMLAGGRKGEVKAVDNRRGRERGLVEENEDMSISDMVKEERRTRGQVGGEGRRFAERIAKDGKFDDDLEYLDENAAKLAKRVQKSEINLKNTAISDLQRMNRALDACPLCHHEDTNTPPVAPVVSLATRVYLTLPTEPEIGDGGASIIPIQHRSNLLECDDDEWEEIRNFMKSLTRMYHDQGRDVIFYENAADLRRKKHGAMEVVPLPYSLGDTAPAFFKEAIVTSDEEWTQHKKLIDTLARSRGGLGKLAFRRTLVKEMPYFHVWFEIDGGLGHVVEDTNRWPKGDLFAREVIGGMLDREPDVIKRQGKWVRGTDRRTEGFRAGWRKFDWTRVLTDN